MTLEEAHNLYLSDFEPQLAWQVENGRPNYTQRQAWWQSLLGFLHYREGVITNYQMRTWKGPRECFEFFDKVDA